MDEALAAAIDYFNANARGSGKAFAADGGIVIFAAGNEGSSDAYYPGYYAGAAQLHDLRPAEASSGRMSRN